jgi:hypothetical protein
MSKKRTASFWLFVGIRVFSIILIIVTMFTGHWLGMFNAGLTLFVTFIPNILQKKWNIVYPIELWVVVLLFVMAALIFGEAFDFYYKFGWWDDVLHVLSGFVIAMVAFIFIKQLNENADIRVTLSPFFAALFAVSFSMAISVVWEIFEYSMDTWFGTNMQKSGLVDTMHDLIVATIGAVIVGVMGYLYLKNGANNLIGRMIEKQEKLSTKQ